MKKCVRNYYLLINRFEPIFLLDFIFFYLFVIFFNIVPSQNGLTEMTNIFRLLEQWQGDAIRLCGESPHQLTAALKRKLIKLCKPSASPRIYACSHQCRSFTLSLIRRTKMDVRDSLSELLAINNLDFKI